jgi:hypothetical protein
MDRAKNRSDHRKRTPMIIQRLRALLFRSIRKPVTQSKGYAVVSADEAAQDPYRYIFVNDDGTARELHAADRVYLEQTFKPFDGGRPYIKSDFKALDGWGNVKGFLERSKLPSGLFVAPAPANDPNPPMNRAEHLAFIGEKAVQFGFEVTEKPDGTVEMRRPTKK